MPVKNFVSRNGQVEYEYDDLGDILTYGRDALGNVVAGYDAATNAVFTADYKPYGEFAATTGNVAGRRFMWVGSWGYRFTSGVPVSHYVRARHLSMRMGMWTSVDPLWPSEPAFAYVGGMPTAFIDPLGLQGNQPPRRIGPPKQMKDRPLPTIRYPYARHRPAPKNPPFTPFSLLCCKDQAKPSEELAEAFCLKNNLGRPVDGSICNAMKHCVWNCLTSRKCGGTINALFCSDKHEKDPPFPHCPTYRGSNPKNGPPRPNPRDHKCMDLYNNRIGLQCASGSGSCDSCCEKAAKNGLMQVVRSPYSVPGFKESKRDCLKGGNVTLPHVDL